jgi:hypothetical protein
MAGNELLVHANIRMTSNSALSFDQTTNFPLSPHKGQFSLISGILYIYANLGGVETWFPLTNKKSSHVHYQALASTQWSVTHNYATTDLIMIAYDDAGTVMIVNPVFVDENHFQLNFGTAIKGKVVVFAHSDLWVPRMETTEGFAQQLTLAQYLNVAEDKVIIDNAGVHVDGVSLTTWIQKNDDRIGIIEYLLESDVDPAITAERLAALEESLTTVQWGDIVGAPNIDDLQAHPAQDFTNVEVANLRSGKSASGETMKQTQVFGGDSEPTVEEAGSGDLWFDTSGDATLVKKKNKTTGTFDFVAQIASEMLMKHSEVALISGASDITHTFMYDDDGTPTQVIIKPNFLSVYLNRQLLRKSEYTLDNETTVTILVALSSGDELEIVTA